jgi:hypothetical protein
MLQTICDEVRVFLSIMFLHAICDKVRVFLSIMFAISLEFLGGRMHAYQQPLVYMSGMSAFHTTFTANFTVSTYVVFTREYLYNYVN